MKKTKKVKIVAVKNILLKLNLWKILIMIMIVSSKKRINLLKK